MPQQLLSDESRTERREGMRTRAFGQNYQPTIVDRFGVWLSARQIQKCAGSMNHKEIGDFGCGYNAAFVRTVLAKLDRAVLIDSTVADDLKSDPKVTVIEGILPGVLKQLPPDSLDVVLCISVLEHLWDPKTALEECFRIVRPGGICLFNVPSWRGKWFLEFSAFRLGLSPRDEVMDHKTYYDVNDFQPMLMQAGFRSDDIRCFSHKFGLNTFAVCTKWPAPRATL
jgi:2-polyprenyl-3-methyl-5-hydroxy-6-metoxy-1,4-benzoquinol methylase